VYLGVSQKRERKSEEERVKSMLLYVCEECGSWHVFINLAEMLKLSGKIGLVACVNGCGLMIQVRTEDRLNVRFAPAKVEQVK